MQSILAGLMDLLVKKQGELCIKITLRYFTEKKIRYIEYTESHGLFNTLAIHFPFPLEASNNLLFILGSNL
jgi:hypothetical protein